MKPAILIQKQKICIMLQNKIFMNKYKFCSADLKIKRENLPILLQFSRDLTFDILEFAGDLIVILLLFKLIRMCLYLHVSDTHIPSNFSQRVVLAVGHRIECPFLYLLLINFLFSSSLTLPFLICCPLVVRAFLTVL